MKDQSYRTGNAVFGKIRDRIVVFRSTVAILALVAIATTFTACTGGGAGGAAPLVGIATAGVEDSLGRSPENVINAETADEVEVVIDLPESVAAGDLLVVILSDNADNQVVTEVPVIEDGGQASSYPATGSTGSLDAVAAGSGQVTVGPIDATSLNDGPISMTVIVRRGDQEVSTDFGPILSMDTAAPLAAIGFNVPAGATSPEGVVNAANAAAATVEVTFDGTADPSDLATVEITDGVVVVTSLAENVSPGNTVAFSGINLTSLQDGPLQATVQIIDGSENLASFPASFDKDTQVAAFVAARVAAGGENAENQVNLTSQDNVTVEVEFGPTTQAGDTVSVVVNDGVNAPFPLGTVESPAGAATVSFGPVSFANFAQGAVTITAQATDAAGNLSQIVNGNVAHDTELTEVASARFDGFDGGDRDVTIIGGAQTLAKVRVFFSENTFANESISFNFTHLESGANVAAGPFAVTAGQSGQVFGPFDLSALPEGEIRLDWSLSDTSGNRRIDRGQNGLIDRTAHIGPNSMFILTTAGNPNRVANAASVAATTVRVNLPAFDDDTVSARVYLNDGTTELQSGVVSVPVMGGDLDFTGIDASGLVDGTIALAIEFQDGFGNATRYSGSSSFKDTQIALPSNAQIEAGVANAANFVNSQNQTNLTVRVELPSSARQTDFFGLAISDGTNTVNVAPQAAPAGGGSMSFNGIDLSSLNDGMIGITVNGSDSANNQNIMVGMPAMKDVEAPLATRMRVEASTGNGIDELNATNAANPNLTLRFENVGSGDQFRVGFQDSTGATAMSPLQSIASLFFGPASSSVINLNDDFEAPTQQSSATGNERIGDFQISLPAGVGVTSLADGTISLRLEIVDPAGNATVFVGLDAQKATDAHTPTLARIVAGAQNAQDVVNIASVGSVAIEVVMPATATTTDMVRVRLADGSQVIDSAPQAAPAGGGTMTFTMDLSGLNDGNVSVNATVENPGLQTAQFQGVLANKDTMAPNFVVLATPTNIDDSQIGVAEAGSVDFRITMSGVANGGDTFDFSVTDGTTPVVLASGVAMPANDQAIPGELIGGSDLVFNYPGNDLTGFNDGALTANFTITDAAGNTQSGSAGIATLDTAPPTLPSQVFIQEGPTWGRNELVVANTNAATIQVNTDATNAADDRMEIVLVDGSGSDLVIDGGLVGTPGSRRRIQNLDLSNLPDGVGSLRVRILDRAGNASSVTTAVYTKDATAPGAPSAVGIAMGSNNLANGVAVANEASAQIDLTFGADSFAGDQIELEVTDTVTTVTATPMSAPQGAGSVSFAGLDLSGLNDGSLAISVTITDPLGNVTTASGSLTKDATVAAVNSTEIPAGMDNLLNQVTQAIENAVSIDVDFDAAADGTETATVSVTDGTSTVAAFPASIPLGGGVQTFGPFDLSGFADGALTINVEVSDTSSNAVVTTQAITKAADAIAPSAALLPSGAGNAADVVNLSNVTAISFDVTYGAMAVGTENVEVTLGDGTTTINFGTQSPANGGGTLTFGPMDVTTLTDVALTLTVTTTDAIMNVDTFTKTITKDVAPPTAASGISIPMSSDNAIDFVTLATANAVAFDVTFGADSDAANTVDIAVDAGGSPVNGTQANAPTGAGTVNFTGLDLSGLADGSLTATVTVTDAAGNSATSMVTVTKDATLVPVTSAGVVSGGGNALNVVNASNVATTSIDVVFPASADGTENAAVTLSDGTATVSFGSQAITSGGATLTYGPMDVSSLADSGLTLTVTTTDNNGNSVDTTQAVTKDVSAPTAAASITIPMSSDNAADFVSLATEMSVQFDVTFGADSDDANTVDIDVDAGGSPVSGTQTMAPDGAGTVNFTGLDLSGLADGSLTATVTVTDAAGNSTTSMATVTKDATVVPVTSAEVTADGSNPQNVVNVASVGSTNIQVVFPASADGTENAEVVLDDGVAPINFGSQAVTSGGATLTYGPIDVSALAEGSLTIRVTVTDGNGNEVETTQAVTKDATVPAQPTAAVVPSTGANQPANFVNIATESSASVEVTFPATSASTDMFTVTLDDGSNNFTTTPTAASDGAGSVTVNSIDLSGFNETTITIAVDITDAADNDSTTFSGTAATKDVTVPASAIVDPVTSPTAVSTQVVTGSTEDSASVEITGGASTATGTADTSGFFSVTVSLTEDATNTLNVTTRDEAGNPAVAATTTDFNAAALSVVEGATPSVTFAEDAVARGLADTGSADGGAFADIDGDGDLDLFLAQGSAGILYENDGMGNFTDITGSAGVTFVGNLGAVWGDYDNDGDLDLLTLDSTAGTTLYRNDGSGTFSDQTTAESANVASSTGSQIYWLDHDQDGFLDFLVLDVSANSNVIMLNQRGAMTPSNSFAAASGTGIETAANGSGWGTVADFDVDGDIDVLFSNGGAGSLVSNAAGAYSAVAGVTFDVQTLASPSVFMDYDNDGDLDIFIAHGGAGDTNLLYRNDAGTFVNTGLLALDQFFGMNDLTWGDFDHDGVLDMVFGGSGSNNSSLIRQSPLGSFGLDTRISDADNILLAQMVDVDGDGDLDVFYGKASGTANALYINSLNNFNFLKVNVTGTGTGSGTSSSDARGAVVTLKLTDGTVVASREVNGGRGRGSQDAGPIHFGGIAPSRQYMVEVSFPSGTTQMMTVTPRLLANQTVTISE